MYIYFLKLKGEVVYVGKTKNFNERFKFHHILNSDHEIEIAECNTETDMDIYEIYYINLLKPPLNNALKNQDSCTLEFKKLRFYRIENTFKNTFKKEADKQTKKDKDDYFSLDNKLIKRKRKDQPIRKEFITYSVDELSLGLTKKHELLYMLLKFNSVDNVATIGSKDLRAVFTDNRTIKKSLKVLYDKGLIDRCIDEGQQVCEFMGFCLLMETSNEIKITYEDFLSLTSLPRHLIKSRLLIALEDINKLNIQNYSYNQIKELLNCNIRTENIKEIMECSQYNRMYVRGTKQ